MKSAVAGKNAQGVITPLREASASSALVLDIDGTIAPIVPRPEDASVPPRIRELMTALQARYALVACVSGRRARDARRVVGIDSLHYVGNHGLERLRAGASGAEPQPGLEAYRDQVLSFATDSYNEELRELGVRLEDKDVIWSFHWREAADETASRAALMRVAAAAEANGLVPHWGRKVLEIRPPVPFGKGSALESLLGESDFEAALYAGDDTTDLDAFRKLRELRASGRLPYSVCVGVISAEGPPEIAGEADLRVDGPDGMAELLEALL
jgi:trehalose 6-phosphate phosphatase